MVRDVNLILKNMRFCGYINSAEDGIQLLFPQSVLNDRLVIIQTSFNFRII